MNRVRARTLKPYERQKLKRMKRHLSSKVNSLHARIILLSCGGESNAQIAERCDCTPTWVRTIIHRFNEGGLDAISWYLYYCGPAGPRKFITDIREQICEVALSPPKELIRMAVWSLEKLREYLVAQKIVPSISLEWLRQILRQRKIRWRHTKTWKESADPQFWPKYRKIRQLYARRPKGGRRLSIKLIWSSRRIPSISRSNFTNRGLAANITNFSGMRLTARETLFAVRRLRASHRPILTKTIRFSAGSRPGAISYGIYGIIIRVSTAVGYPSRVLSRLKCEVRYRNRP